MRTGKLVLLAVLALIVIAFFAFGGPSYLNLESFREYKSTLDAWVQAHFLVTLLAFFVVYIIVTAVSLPGAAVMTLAAGALFGLLWGTVMVSFASSIGATLAFLASRYLLRDWVQKRFGDRLGALNRGIEREGAFYLFALRLVPVFPFFLINLLMGLTPIRTVTFYWVSQVGMLAGTLVYVNAGTQLAQVTSPGDILSWELLLSFALLGVFPLLAKYTLGWIRHAWID
jgi:uncharacterized membrane protein YdjX (TVP38/TMEM64 family)